MAEGLRRCWSMFPLTRVPCWNSGFLSHSHMGGSFSVLTVPPILKLVEQRGPKGNQPFWRVPPKKHTHTQIWAASFTKEAPHAFLSSEHPYSHTHTETCTLLWHPGLPTFLTVSLSTMGSSPRKTMSMVVKVRRLKATVDGCEIHFAPPKRPWNEHSPVNTGKSWFPIVSKWCRILSIHSMFADKNALNLEIHFPWTFRELLRSTYRKKRAILAGPPCDIVVSVGEPPTKLFPAPTAKPINGKTCHHYIFSYNFCIQVYTCLLPCEYRRTPTYTCRYIYIYIHIITNSILT